MAKLSVPDVAKRLGKDPEVVRAYIKAGLYPFAVAIKPEGRVKWDYTIFPAKFEEYCATTMKKEA